MRNTFFALILTIPAAALFACGGSAPAPNPPSTPSVEDAGAPATPSTSDAGATSTSPTSGTDAGAASAKTDGPVFDTLSDDQKAEIMMTKVVPNVGKVFKEYDAKKYAKFGCATCHGPGKKKEAPQKILPKLTMSNGGFEKMQKAKPDVVKFMSEKVVPEMAAALGEPPFDPKTHKGFGCGGCHALN